MIERHHFLHTGKAYDVSRYRSNASGIVSLKFCEDQDTLEPAIELKFIEGATNGKALEDIVVCKPLNGFSEDKEGITHVSWTYKIV